jgi:hypothetical protein
MWISTLLTAILFFLMLLALELGYRAGRRAQDAGASRKAGTGVVQASVFGLLGLMLAFAYGGAATRLQVRRQQIVEEANAIGTAYLRISLLPREKQSALREKFRVYLDTRLSVYRALPDIAKAEAQLARAAEMQLAIWEDAIIATAGPGNERAVLLFLPAVNSMIDITTARTVAGKTHIPTIALILLIGLAVLSAVLAGYAMSDATPRNWLHMIGFALVISLTVYVILDLEYPRIGLIRLDAADAALLELRDSIR